MKNKFYGSVFVIWLYLQKAMYRICDPSGGEVIIISLIDMDASFLCYVCEFYSSELPYILRHSQQLHSGDNLLKSGKYKYVVKTT